jgi:hypothetical protein
MNGLLPSGKITLVRFRFINLQYIYVKSRVKWPFPFFHNAFLFFNPPLFGIIEKKKGEAGTTRTIPWRRADVSGYGKSHRDDQGVFQRQGKGPIDSTAPFPGWVIRAHHGHGSG